MNEVWAVDEVWGVDKVLPTDDANISIEDYLLQTRGPKTLSLQVLFIYGVINHWIWFFKFK